MRVFLCSITGAFSCQRTPPKSKVSFYLFLLYFFFIHFFVFEFFLHRFLRLFLVPPLTALRFKLLPPVFSGYNGILSIFIFHCSKSGINLIALLPNKVSKLIISVNSVVPFKR